MAIEIKRKEKETPQSLIYRFTKAVRESGILLEARKRLFKDRNRSELAKKRSALRRLELKELREKQEKMAKPQ